MADISRLAVQLELQSAQFQRGMDMAAKQMERTARSAEKANRSFSRMERQMNRMGKSALTFGKAFAAGILAQLTALAAGGFVRKTKELADRLDEIAKTARGLGLTSEQLQGLRFAASLAGIEAQALTKSVRSLLTQMLGAERGLQTSVEYFDRLGVSATTAEGEMKQVTEILPEIADAFVRMDNDAEKAAIAVALFGRAGVQMVGFLEQGSAKIDDFIQSASDLGLIVDGELAEASERFNDTMSAISQVIEAQMIPMLIAMQPLIVAVAKWFLKASINLRIFIEDLTSFWSSLGDVEKKLIVLSGVVAAFLLLFKVSPIAAFIAALATGAVLVITNWEKLKILWIELDAGIKGMQATFAHGVANMLEAASGFAQGLVDAVFWAVNIVIEKIGDMVRAVVEKLNTYLIAPLRKAIEALPGDFEGPTNIETPNVGVGDTFDAPTVPGFGAETQRTRARAIEQNANALSRTAQVMREVGTETEKTSTALDKFMGLLTGEGDGTGSTPPGTPDTGDGGGGSKAKGGKGSSKGKKTPEDKLISIAEAMQKVGDASREELAGTAIDSVMSFTDALIDGEANFKDFAVSLLKDMGKIIARAIVMNALLKATGMVGADALPGGGSWLNALGQKAGLGGAEVKLAKGGVVGSPTSFITASAKNGLTTGLMGEAGPEAVMPLSRDASGNLGVAGPNVSVHNYSGEPAVVKRSDNDIEIIVGRAVKAAEANFSRSMATGQGSYARALEGGYKAKRNSS